jgi:hypothetical protein
MHSARITLLACAALTLTACERQRPDSVTAPTLHPNTSNLSGSSWYVSPSGSSGNTGSSASPWDLATALSGGHGNIAAGDTVWMLGGTYGSGTDYNTSVTTGTASAHVVFKQYPGAHATIDGRLRIHNAYLTFWGFEIKQNPTANAGYYGVEEYRGGVSLINLVIHDANKSGIIVNWPFDGDSILVYGCIIYNNGTSDNLDHGIYAQDSSTSKILRMEGNVIFDNVGYGIHSYTESSALHSVQAVRNVLFNSGSTGNPTAYNVRPNILFGGTVGGATGMVADSNYLFEQNSSSYENDDNLQAGYPNAGNVNNQDVTIVGNTIWGGNAPLQVYMWQHATVENNVVEGGPFYDRMVDLATSNLSGETWSSNTFYGSASSTLWWYNAAWRTLSDWETQTGLSGAGSAASAPSTATYFLNNNRYDSKRALLVVFNWPGSSTVNVSLAGFASSGDSYSVYNVQNFYGSAVASGTYSGGTISIPMTGTTPPAFNGRGWSATPPTTGPYFHAFIVTKP